MNTKRTTFAVLFFIKKSKALRNGEAPIYVRITYNGTSADFSTKCSIPSKQWDQKSGGCIGKDQQTKNLNSDLEQLRFKCHNAKMELNERNESVTALAIKNRMFGLDKDNKMILEVYSEHNKSLKKGIGITISQNTYKRHKTTKAHIARFIKQNKSTNDISLRDINLSFIQALEQYFRIDRKCNHNSTMKYLKNLKKITTFAFNNGWMSKDPFVGFRFSFEKTTQPFLTDKELQVLSSKDFEISRLDNIRDIFLFCCYSGLAFADVKSLKSEHIVIGTYGKKWIKKPRQKTGITSILPLLRQAQLIINKYADHPKVLSEDIVLPVPSNQKMNAYLKEIADLCGINKVLTTHVARHTFATTVTLSNDVPIEIVAKMLGHSSIRQTGSYAIVEENLISRHMKQMMLK